MAGRTGGYSVEIGVISDTSPAAQSIAAGDIVAGFENFKHITIDAALVGATGGTLDVYLQRLVGAVWVDWFHFTQLSAGAAAVRYTVDNRSTTIAGLVAVGSGLTPSISATLLSCAHPGSSVRAVYDAGVSTSAGAAVSITFTGHQPPTN